MTIAVNHILGRVSQCTTRLPSVQITRVPLRAFKVAKLATEPMSSVRTRGPNASPYTFKHAMMQCTVPDGATIVPLRPGHGIPIFRTDRFRVDRIFAPVADGWAIECDKAFSPMNEREYAVGVTHWAKLNTDPDTIIANGIYYCSTWKDAEEWARRILNVRNFTNHIAHIDADFQCISLL